MPRIASLLARATQASVAQVSLSGLEAATAPAAPHYNCCHASSVRGARGRCDQHRARLHFCRIAQRLSPQTRPGCCSQGICTFFTICTDNSKSANYSHEDSAAMISFAPYRTVARLLVLPLLAGVASSCSPRPASALPDPNGRRSDRQLRPVATREAAAARRRDHHRQPGHRRRQRPERQPAGRDRQDLRHHQHDRSRRRSGTSSWSSASW